MLALYLITSNDSCGKQDQLNSLIWMENGLF